MTTIRNVINKARLSFHTRWILVSLICAAIGIYMFWFVEDVILRVLFGVLILLIFFLFNYHEKAYYKKRESIGHVKWIAEHCIRLRGGTDDWFDLTEIELFARNALLELDYDTSNLIKMSDITGKEPRKRRHRDDQA